MADKIADGDEVLDCLAGRNFIADGKIESISILDVGKIIVRISINMRKESEFRKILIEMTDIAMMNIFVDEVHSLPDIVSCKLFKDSNSYYLSLDPDESTHRKSAEDALVVSGAQIQLYCIE